MKTFHATLTAAVLMVGFVSGAHAVTAVAVKDAAVATGLCGAYQWGDAAMGLWDDHMFINPCLDEEGTSAGLVQFDLPETGGEPVTSAVLRLRHTWNQYPGDVYTLHVNTAGWDEGTVTGFTRPTFDPTSVASITLDDTSDVYRYFDVTPVVQAWYAGTIDNYGFTLARSVDAASASDNFSDYIFIASREHANAALHPMLFVNQPIPEPGTYAMMLAGLLFVGGLARRRLG